MAYQLVTVINAYRLWVHIVYLPYYIMKEDKSVIKANFIKFECHMSI